MLNSSFGAAAFGIVLLLARPSKAIIGGVFDDGSPPEYPNNGTIMVDRVELGYVRILFQKENIPKPAASSLTTDKTA
jgi:hypothetical protein